MWLNVKSRSHRAKKLDLRMNWVMESPKRGVKVNVQKEEWCSPQFPHGLFSRSDKRSGVL